MRKKRDPVAIGNVGVYTEQASEFLAAARDKLINDINSILDNYKGIDAEEQVNKFIEAVSKLSSVIQNLDYYGKYMEKISAFDTDNLNSTKQKFNQMLADSIKEDLAFQTLSLDSINTDNIVVNDNGGDIQ